MSLGGSRVSMFDVNVDGISTRAPSTGTLTPTAPGLDPVQEVLFDYVNNRAEFSEVANISMITRSAENQFHGRVSWDLGNRALNARRFFDTTAAKANRNDFGAVVSGPIRQNKAFFLVDHEGQRRVAESAMNLSVPTLKMRQDHLTARVDYHFSPANMAYFRKP